MRDLQRISLAVTTTFVLLLPAFAEEANDGEMAAAIRSTDYGLTWLETPPLIQLRAGGGGAMRKYWG